MSRSFRKYPASKNSRSDKWARTQGNRCLRRINKVLLNHKSDEDLKILREMSNTWCFPSDGLAHYDKGLIFQKSLEDLYSQYQGELNGVGGWVWRLRRTCGELTEATLDELEIQLKKEFHKYNKK